MHIPPPPIIFSVCVCVSVGVFMCVCVCGYKETKKQNKNKGPVGYSSVLPQVCQTKSIHSYVVLSECVPHLVI